MPSRRTPSATRAAASTPGAPAVSQPSRLERVLVFASLAIIAVSLLSFFSTLIVGLVDRYAVAVGLLKLSYGVSLVGLPIGFLLLIIVLILTQRRRRSDLHRAAREQERSGERV